MGLDPNNITYDALFNRLLEIVLANITLANMFAFIGVIFLVATSQIPTIVPLRVANMVGCPFFAVFGALSGSVGTFILYLLFLPINAIRLRQMLKLIKRARIATEGDTSLEWLKPFMTERRYRRGDKLFKKDDAASEMFLTVTGTFLVTGNRRGASAGTSHGRTRFPYSQSAENRDRRMHRGRASDDHNL